MLAQQQIGGGYAWRQALNPTIGQSHVDGVKADPDWEENKIDCMREVLRIKFTTSPEFRALLVKTGGAELIEDSPYDSFWGVGKLGGGRNMLGKLLMQLRAKLVAEDVAAAVRASAVATIHVKKPKKPRVFASSSSAVAASAAKKPKAPVVKKRAFAAAAAEDAAADADDEADDASPIAAPPKKKKVARKTK